MKAVQSPYLIPFDHSFKIQKAKTSAGKQELGKREAKERLSELVDSLAKRQRLLFAQDKYAILFVFQAMDAAGKDGTIRAVTSGINPAGFQVHSFKQPSHHELDHDFLWRTTRCLPERGRIGIFNRSHYEEVLVVRVHPKYLSAQRLPSTDIDDHFWDQRYESIRDHEKHLARNGTLIVKFFLNVSKDEQKSRFLDRINDQRKNWKFSSGDVAEREHWEAYMKAYEKALNETSRAHAPWYVIPADHKPTMRAIVADIMSRTLDTLDLHYPELSNEGIQELDQMRERLESEDTH